MQNDPLVYIVDDDPMARQRIVELVAARGVRTESYATAEEFLERFDRRRAGCLILDLRLPGIDAIELQRQLIEQGIRLPVVVITAYADIRSAVEAMRTGAITFLEKPLNDEELWENICRGLERHRRECERSARTAELRRRYAELSTRERRVMEMVVAGKLNKSIAAELEISLRTVELCRASVFRKMGVESLVDLVRAHLELFGHQSAAGAAPESGAPADQSAELARAAGADSGQRAQPADSADSPGAWANGQPRPRRRPNC